MTFPAMVLPGQRLTADRLNAGFAVGRLVFVAFRDAAQSLADSTVGTSANALSWDNVELDILGGWSASNPTRFTPPIAGWYQLTGGTAFAASTSGTFRGVSWLVNGGVIASGTAKPVVAAPASTVPTVTARTLSYELGTTDYVELSPFQNTGGALNTSGASLRPHIAVYYVGPS